MDRRPLPGQPGYVLRQTKLFVATLAIAAILVWLAPVRADIWVWPIPDGSNTSGDATEGSDQESSESKDVAHPGDEPKAAIRIDAS